MKAKLPLLALATIFSLGTISSGAEVEPLLPAVTEQVIHINVQKGFDSDIVKKYALEQIKQALDSAEQFIGRGEYDKAIQVLETAQRTSPNKNILMQIGQAYELWSEQESGKKQTTLTKKAIEAYKQVKTAEAKEHITELQQRLK